MDFGARAPVCQAFGRALKHDPKAAAVYKDLDDNLKLQFRRSWALKRDFNFTKETRSVSLKHTQESCDQGEMMNALQIANALGGVAFESARKQAAHYIEMCKKLQDKWVSRNSMTGVTNYLFVRKLLNESDAQTWEQLSESYTTENVWETRALESRARANFAEANNRPTCSVTVEEVKASDLGLEGWAQKEKHPAAAAKAKAKAKPEKPKPEKPKPKPKDRQGKQDTKTLQDAQQLLACIQKCHLEIERAKTSASQSEDWSWASSFFAQYDAAKGSFEEAEADFAQFAQDFKAAVISPAALRDFKKTQGDDLLPNLVRFNDRLGPHKDTLLGICEKVRRMSQAQNATASSSAPAQAGKRRRKS